MAKKSEYNYYEDEEEQAEGKKSVEEDKHEDVSRSKKTEAKKTAKRWLRKFEKGTKNGN